jgi:hypothetical protein
LREGFQLTKDMKSKKIKDMKMIDEIFERITKKIHLKKAMLKKEYNEAFHQELERVNIE